MWNVSRRRIGLALRPRRPRYWWGFIKPMVVLLCAVSLLLVFIYGDKWLDKLDSPPIRAYTLTTKTQFTTAEDVRRLLATPPPVRGYLQPGSSEKTARWTWLSWNYTLLQAALSQQPPLKGYWTQEVSEVQERFLELSWVKSAMVRKIYPNKLSLALIEHQPVAVWNEKRYLSQDAVIFDLPEGRFDAKGLPILFGPDSESKVVWEAWKKIKQDLMVRNLGLYSVEMDNRGSWTILLDNGVVLHLGRGDWIPKIDRFVTIFPEIEVAPDQRLSYVDLRYEHGAAVGFSKK